MYRTWLSAYSKPLLSASLASFTVDGVPVDASAPGVVFENGTAAAIVDGARVEVEGTFVNGVLKATKVDVRQDDEVEAEVELEGAITAVDAQARTFVLRGQTVTWTDATVFDGGTAADLKVNAQVHVHGTLTANGTLVEATDIEFDH